MKKLSLLFSLLVLGVAVVAAAQSTSTATAKSADPATAQAAAASKTRDIAAEVVAPDEAKKALTFRTEAGEKTLPVDAKATASLKSVRSGDKVTLTVRDNDQGEAQSIVSIKAAPAEPKQ
jgi:ribosomal protein S1